MKIEFDQYGAIVTTLDNLWQVPGFEICLKNIELDL